MNVRFAVSIVFLLLLSTGCPGANFRTDAMAMPQYAATITAVVDGDTVKVRFEDALPEGCRAQETVRLIGVDTPELYSDPPDYYAREARDFTNQYWLADITIALDQVSNLRDRYGRLLAYVYPGNSDTTLNEKLIREGYGFYYGYFDFDPVLMRRFQQAEAKARAGRCGLWQ
jgi:endonuclease YncB( thermonuclease family)